MRGTPVTLAPLLALSLGAAACSTAVPVGVETTGEAPEAAITSSAASGPPALDLTTTNKKSTPRRWSALVQPDAIPLGDGNISTTPKTDNLYSCQTTFPPRGPSHGGPWIDKEAGTWDSLAKVSVDGKQKWPQATYLEKTRNSKRIITSNDLPIAKYTGTFPIDPDDDAYQYDRNPNAISVKTVRLKLDKTPQKASSASCVQMGAIGVLKNGVLLDNALDGIGEDAAAHEAQDACDAHPDGTQAYHFHAMPDCLLSAVPGRRGSTLVGYALDGYGIYVERDKRGNLPANADLDRCHGRSSTVTWNGEKQKIYHYSATLEYPYTVGCYRGTPVTPPAHA